MIQKIGSMVHQLRKKLMVKQEDLCRGLLSDSELSRVERGEKEGDSFLMTALFQRLGKSMDQFEMTVSNDEYKLILLRAFIQESMESGDYDRTEELIEVYEESRESEKLLHQQYIQLVRTVCAYLKGANKAECLEQLQESMELTFVDEGRSDWSNYYFCIQEIQLLLLIAHIRMEVGKTGEARELLENLRICIDARYTSEVSKVQVYPKCCYLLAKAYLEEGRKEEAYEAAEKGIRNLVKTRFLTFMEELLALQQECKFDEEREEQLKAIRFAYELAEYEAPKEFVVRLLFNGISEEVTLNSELLREMRKAQGMTQEQVSADICSRETYARIENGRTPNKSKLKDLLQRLGIERERYNSYVVTDDWDTYEMVRNYKRNSFEENQDDALEILYDIETRLDMSVIENRQFIETAKLRYKIKKKDISNEEAIAQLKELLTYTMPEYDEKLVRIPTREEFIILNRIALCMRQIGKKEEALDLYREIVKKYQVSEVRTEHHVFVTPLLHLNYFASLFDCGRNLEAEEVAIKGIKFILKYQRGDMLGFFMANLACVYQNRKAQAEDLHDLKILISSRDLLKLYELHKQSKAVCRRIDECYTCGFPKLGP